MEMLTTFLDYLNYNPDLFILALPFSIGAAFLMTAAGLGIIRALNNLIGILAISLFLFAGTPILLMTLLIGGLQGLDRLIEQITSNITIKN